MLRFTHKAGNVLHYEVRDRLSAEDLRAYYATIDVHYRGHGKLRLLVRVHNFKGYDGLRALLIFARYEPGLLRKVERYAAMTNQRWFWLFINAADALIPTLRLRAFRRKEEVEAQIWLHD